jgi:hypothetical protein
MRVGSARAARPDVQVFKRQRLGEEQPGRRGRRLR